MAWKRYAKRLFGKVIMAKETAMDRLRNGKARVEFLAVKNEVAVLFEQGNTIMAVYETLVQEQRITMKYITFRGYVRNAFGKRPPLERQNCKKLHSLHHGKEKDLSQEQTKQAERSFPVAEEIQETGHTPMPEETRDMPGKEKRTTIVRAGSPVSFSEIPIPEHLKVKK